MFPFSFEWHWDMSHIVFMGGLWYAICIMALGVNYVLGKSFMQTIKGDSGHGHDDHGHDGHGEHH
ncbi:MULTISPECIES: hypothetical protein [Desulfatibacillum]|jgi:hypothetical protein|uniref:Uncharacterized protein n=2 Tax=Desulfatibacillum TaxID=218207 RepID=B8F9M8_DESAL|nr:MULTISPECIES: hypothetical protein [Desulfatibacillum]ACL02974.1 conserved hypothetical protein [Desulfatibacillum aliphaticivorans]SHL08070.1 hypothetical protein SAMN02745216_04579 [Desulfatibacillum alkenivorans DSM 16219]